MTTESEAAAPAKAPSWRSATAWVAGVAVSALILSALAFFVDTGEVADAASRAKPAWLAAAFACFGGATLCRWWRVVLLSRAGSPRALMGVSSGHALLNKILPLRTGELTFPLLYRRVTGAPLRAGIVLLATLRVSELACLLPLYAAALAVYAASLHWVSIVAAAIVGVGLQLALPFALRSVGRLKVFRNASEEVDAMGTQRLLALAAINTLVWICLFGLYFTSLRAFAVDVTPPQAIVGAGGAIVTNLLPVNGIGSLGTLEAGWTAGLAATGAAPGPALTAGLAMHAITILGNVPFLLAGLGPLLRRPAATGSAEGMGSDGHGPGERP